MRRILKNFLYRFIRPMLLGYLKKPRIFKYKKLRLTVLPGVFHPGFFFSTKILLQFVETLELKNKTLLELGAGSGAVGFYAEKLGAITTLSDINKTAIQGLKMNAKSLNSSARIIESNLFEKIKDQFDFIIINPPYYPKDAKTEEELAWYCGEGFEYFQSLFAQLSSHLNGKLKVFMILSQDCDTERIQQLAIEKNLTLELKIRKRIMLEWNYIFCISKEPNSGF